MRTIVALFIAAAAVAQVPLDVDRLERGMASHPVPNAAMQALQRALSTTENVPLDQLRAARRELILWLIEHQPESRMFDEPYTLLWLHGRMGDPEGFAQAARLWKQQAAKPDASPKTIANAAIFFRTTSAPEGFAILDTAAADHPGDPDLARARGVLDVSVMVGVSGIGEGGNRIHLATNAARRATSAAADAREAIEASKDARLVGAAGDFLTRTAMVALPNDVTFGDDDGPVVAERWLRKARELSPPGDEWTQPLATAIHQRAQRAFDPREKIRLLREVYSLTPDPAKPGLRPEMTLAEFDSGEDAAAGEDAKFLADSPRNAQDYNLGQTVLGRIAMARGDKGEAKERLAASIGAPEKFKNPVFEPNMTLAQDVYDAGDRDSVLAFLEASRAVWKFDRGRIDRMIRFVQKAPAADLVQLSRQLPGNELLRKPAPPFTAVDQDGQKWTPEQLSGTVVALEFGQSPLAERMSRDFMKRGFVFLKVQDEDTKGRFEILTDPTVVVIDRQGIVTGYRSGSATEAEWRNEFDSGFGRGSAAAFLPAPKQAQSIQSENRKAVVLAWEPIEEAESYLVEWDSGDATGWTYDRDHSVRVIPTRETSAQLDVGGLARVRWRVYAIPKSGPSGTPSGWQELDPGQFTKIYK